MKTTPTYKNLPHSLLMSVALCLFGVFFSSQAYAQHEDLLDKTWYLYKLEIDGEEYPYHNLDIQSGDESRMKVIDYNINELTASIDRKSTRLNSSHVAISYAVFCLKKKKKNRN